MPPEYKEIAGRFGIPDDCLVMTSRDGDGIVFVDPSSPEAHIPLDEYEFEAISDLFGVAGLIKIPAVLGKHIHPDDNARDDRHEIWVGRRGIAERRPAAVTCWMRRGSAVRVASP